MKGFGLVVVASLAVTASADAPQRWHVVNRGLGTLSEGSRSGIHLDEAPGDGVAWLEGRDVGDGVIELDVRGRDVFQRSFVGVAFHGVDDRVYEAVYFRPFNFRTDDATRRSHAVQYVSQPDYTWQRLRGERPGQYEQPVQPAPDPNGWFHVRIVLAGAEVSVFVGDAKEASLKVERLASQSHGRVGVWVGNGSAGDFSNFEIRPAAGAAAGSEHRAH